MGSDFKTEYANLAESFLEEYEADQAKPGNKARASRMRKLSQAMSNIGADFRKQSVAENK